MILQMLFCALNKKDIGEIINIGGFEVSIKELLEKYQNYRI